MVIEQQKEAKIKITVIAKNSTASQDSKNIRKKRQELFPSQQMYQSIEVMCDKRYQFPNPERISILRNHSLTILTLLLDRSKIKQQIFFQVTKLFVEQADI